MLLRLLTFLCLVVVAESEHAWINEFHYRNYRQDRNLFIEIAGPAHHEAWRYLLIMYQGRDGIQFHDGISLSGLNFTDSFDGDIGFIAYHIPSYGAIRNGKKHGDGIALVYNSVCVQFICYGEYNNETFTATTGPCKDQMCQNIGVHEARDNPAGNSLQMEGEGRLMNDFTWHNEPIPWTPGRSNTGQLLLSSEEDVSHVVVPCHERC
jgi:hypothetical protein